MLVLCPVLKIVQKPMLKIGDKPMLEILLDQCISSGFRSFYFSVNYLKEQIIDYYDGSRWGVTIQYLQKMSLGTAGSLQLLLVNISLFLFSVINGDAGSKFFDPIRLMQYHFEHQAKAISVCAPTLNPAVPFGVVQTNGVELSGLRKNPHIYIK